MNLAVTTGKKCPNIKLHGLFKDVTEIASLVRKELEAITNMEHEGEKETLLAHSIKWEYQDPSTGQWEYYGDKMNKVKNYCVSIILDDMRYTRIILYNRSKIMARETLSARAH